MKTMSRALLSLVVAALVGGCTRGGGAGDGSGDQSKKDEPLRVAAASDLSNAFKEIGPAFEHASGKKVAFSFGATGTLEKQIAEGAPFDVFAAANVSYADDAAKAGACLADTKKIYAQGHLVVWSKDPAMVPSSIEGLKDPKYAKIAIANPEHAPYGKAAQQALTKAGVWPGAKDRGVYGENVQQTLMFAQSGNADVAVVALSIAMAAGGKYVAVDTALHDPLDQAMIVCRGGEPRGPGGGRLNEARAFLDFVSSEPGRAIMRKYGFLLPGESLPAK
jgi:molybdate transport system substrate-binding protein